MVYDYVVLEASGKERKGSMEAKSEDQVRSALKGDNLVIMSIKEQDLLHKDIQISFGSAVKPREMCVFCRQMCSILSSGVTIIEALRMLSEQTENKVFKKAIRDVQKEVERGETLASALAMQPKIFPPILINMVEAGEASGSLEISFDRMATHFEKDAKLKGLIKKAMIYPIAVLVIAIIVVIVMLVMVIPQFQSTFDQSGMELPGITKFVVACSNGIQEKWWLILIIVAVAFIGLKYFKKTDTGKNLFSKLGLKLPMFGTLTIKQASARLSRTLSTLMTSGISMMDALDITARTITNAIVQKAVKDARDEVERGVQVSLPLEASGIFPPMVYHMTRIGEETGNMEEMLDRIASYYEEEVELATQSLISALEPLIIVVLAVICVVIILAVYLPMLQIYKAADNA